MKGTDDVYVGMNSGNTGIYGYNTKGEASAHRIIGSNTDITVHVYSGKSINGAVTLDIIFV